MLKKIFQHIKVENDAPAERQVLKRKLPLGRKENSFQMI